MQTGFLRQLSLACLVIISTAACSKGPDDKTISTTEKGKASSSADQQVIAKVNGKSISKRLLDRTIAIMNQNQPPTQAANSPTIQKAMEKDALNKLIRLELLYQDSLAKNLTTNNSEVDQTINQMKSRFPDEKMFDELLAKNLSSMDEFRSEIFRNLSIKHLIDKEILPNLIVTEEESNAFYNENKDKMKQAESVRVSHILAKLDKNASSEEVDAAKQKVEKIRERITAGEDFAELARASSDCPSAKNGGDLGFIVRGQTVPEFEKCAYGLEKPGQVSEVIKTSFGFHVLKLMEKRPERIIPFEEAQQGISQHLKNQKMNGEIDKYVENLFSKAKIESQIDL